MALEQKFGKQISGKGLVTESGCVAWSVYSVSEREMTVNASLIMGTKESGKKNEGKQK